MPTEPTMLLPRLRQLMLLRDGGGLTDGQLLELFLAQQDEDAFAALVQRHGPMVLGVCRRIVGNDADAEDAFQATFIVLVRKASSIQPRERVGNWLYGVAYRTALMLRTSNRKRQQREQSLEDSLPAAVSAAEPEADWQPLLDHEISRLPDKYRLPVVLCELEGRSRKDAARQLNLPEGTLSSRLATARKRLSQRLRRRGLLLSTGLLPLVPTAALSTSLSVGVLTAARRVAAGQALPAELLSSQTISLTRGVLMRMYAAKLKMIAGLVLLLGLGLLGVGMLTRGALADPPAQKEKAAREGEKAPREGDKNQPEKRRRERDGDRPEKEPRDGDGKRPEKGPREKGRKAVGEKVTLTGKVSKKEEDRKTEDGGTRAFTFYYLTEKNGNKLSLPQPRKRDDGTIIDGFDLEYFVGKQVRIQGTAILRRLSEEADAPRMPYRMTAISDIEVEKK